MIRQLRFSILIVALVIIVCHLALIALHYSGNQLSHQQAVKILSHAFKHEVITTEHYPFKRHGMMSIHSLAGQDLYNECETALGSLGGHSGRWVDAVMPLQAVPKDRNICQALHDYTVTGESYSTRPLKARYLWGWKAIQSNLMKSQTLFAINAYIGKLCYLSIIIFACVLLWHSRPLFLIHLPLVVSATFFGGIQYYSNASLGLSFAAAFLSLSLVAGVYASSASRHIRHGTLAVVACVSSFLFFLDGHLILLISGLFVVIGSMQWFARPTDARAGFVAGVKAVGLFVAVFGASTLFGLLVKVAVAADIGLLTDFFTQASVRMSNAKPYSTEAIVENRLDAVTFLFRPGFYSMGMMRDPSIYYPVLYSSLLSLIVGAGWLLARLVKERAIAHSAVALLIVTGILLSLSRGYFFPNHSIIHHLFVGRYMFVPLALFWSLPVAMWVTRPSLIRKSPSTTSLSSA